MCNIEIKIEETVQTVTNEIVYEISGHGGGLIKIAGYDGYLIDTRGNSEKGRALSGYIFYGKGAYFNGEYVHVEVKNDNPSSNSDFYEPYVQSVRVGQ